MEQNLETPVQAPTDIAGVAIHLSYLRRDMQIMTSKLDGLSNNFASKEDLNSTEKNSVARFSENKALIDDHEIRLRIVEKFVNNLTGRMWGIGIAASVIGGLITLVVNYYLH